MAANSGDMYPLFIMIMKISFGKTYCGFIWYGGATWRCVVILCCHVCAEVLLQH